MLLSLALFTYENTGELQSQHIDLETGCNRFIITDLRKPKEIMILKQLIDNSFFSEITFDAEERLGHASPHIFDTIVCERDIKLYPEPSLSYYIRQMVSEEARVINELYKQKYIPLRNVREADSSLTLYMNVKDIESKIWGTHKFIFTEEGNRLEANSSKFLIPQNSSLLQSPNINIEDDNYITEEDGKCFSWKLISINSNLPLFPTKSLGAGNYRAIVFLKMIHDVLSLFTSTVSEQLFEKESSVQRPYKYTKKSPRSFIKLKSNVSSEMSSVYLNEIEKHLKGETSVFMKKSFPFRIYLQLFKNFYRLRSKLEQVNEYYNLISLKSLLAISLFEYKTYNFYYDFDRFFLWDTSQNEYPGFKISLDIEGVTKRGI